MYGGRIDMSLYKEDEVVSDGYHTMDELYQHRHVLLALAVNTIVEYNENAMTDIFKSKKHSDGTMFDDMFIVMGYLNGRQFSYHVEMKYWNLFKVNEEPLADEWDGHTSGDVLGRISMYIQQRESGYWTIKSQF